jgi:hypothetical protein
MRWEFLIEFVCFWPHLPWWELMSNLLKLWCWFTKIDINIFQSQPCWVINLIFKIFVLSLLWFPYLRLFIYLNIYKIVHIKFSLKSRLSTRFTSINWTYLRRVFWFKITFHWLIKWAALLSHINTNRRNLRSFINNFLLSDYNFVQFWGKFGWLKNCLIRYERLHSNRILNNVVYKNLFFFKNFTNFVISHS